MDGSTSSSFPAHRPPGRGEDRDGSRGCTPGWCWLTPLLSPHPENWRHADTTGFLPLRRDRVARSGAGHAFPPSPQLPAASACELTECITWGMAYISTHVRARTGNSVQGTHGSCHVPRSRWLGRPWNPVRSSPWVACALASALNQTSNDSFSAKVPTSRRQLLTEVGTASLRWNSWKELCFPSP